RSGRLLLCNNSSAWGQGGGAGNRSVRDATPRLAEDPLFSGNEPGTIALVVMYTFSFIVGLAGNVMALMVLTRRRQRLVGGSATRKLLVNLSVCDMMVVCVCMPVNLCHQVYHAWVFGDLLCRAVPFVQAVSVAASVFSLAVISLNRFYSVHSPLHARCFFTARRIAAMICAVWALSSGLCLPILFMNGTEALALPHGTPVVTVCVESWPAAKLRQGYNFLLFCTLYGLPVLFNLVICCLTGRKLWRARDQLGACARCAVAQPASRLKVRKKVAKMVVALVVLFTLSWLPLYALDIWIDFSVEEGRHELGSARHQWLVQGRPFALWLDDTLDSRSYFTRARSPALYNRCFRHTEVSSVSYLCHISYRFPLNFVHSVPKVSFRSDVSRRKRFSTIATIRCMGSHSVLMSTLFISSW
uniref:G-protein coupled receptors family 1 profile domain-containing protein n=1 Tax=Scleropages formosus TaxID=113540 RepID=A0A8C9WEQ3_SCLFO